MKLLMLFLTTSSRRECGTMSNFEIVLAITTFAMCFVSGVLCGITACIVHDINKMIEKAKNKAV